MNIIDSNYRELGNAIVRRAIMDYKHALRYGKEKKIKELENFFRSKWCYDLTSVDGNYIIDKCKEVFNNE